MYFAIFFESFNIHKTKIQRTFEFYKSSWSQTRRDTNFAKPRKQKKPLISQRLFLIKLIQNSYFMMDTTRASTQFGSSPLRTIFIWAVCCMFLICVTNIQTIYTCATQHVYFFLIFFICTPDRTRTGSLRILSPLCLPISPRKYCTL